MPHPAAVSSSQHPLLALVTSTTDPNPKGRCQAGTLVRVVVRKQSPLMVAGHLASRRTSSASVRERSKSGAK
jgi:hypothetical protein